MEKKKLLELAKKVIKMGVNVVANCYKLCDGCLGFLDLFGLLTSFSDFRQF